MTTTTPTATAAGSGSGGRGGRGGDGGDGDDDSGKLPAPNDAGGRPRTDARGAPPELAALARRFSGGGA